MKRPLTLLEFLCLLGNFAHAQKVIFSYDAIGSQQSISSMCIKFSFDQLASNKLIHLISSTLISMRVSYFALNEQFNLERLRLSGKVIAE